MTYFFGGTFDRLIEELEAYAAQFDTRAQAELIYETIARFREFTNPTPEDIAQWIAEGRAVSQYGGKVIVYDSRPEPTAEEWEATYGVTQ